MKDRKTFHLKVAIASIVLARVILPLTLEKPICSPDIVDCYETPSGGWPLEYTTSTGGAFQIFQTNTLYLIIDWFFFFIVIYLLLFFLLRAIENFRHGK